MVGNTRGKRDMRRRHPVEKNQARRRADGRAALEGVLSEPRFSSLSAIESRSWAADPPNRLQTLLGWQHKVQRSRPTQHQRANALFTPHGILTRHWRINACSIDAFGRRLGRDFGCQNADVC
jgi:hypothetical protein